MILKGLILEGGLLIIHLDCVVSDFFPDTPNCTRAVPHSEYSWGGEETERSAPS